MVLQQLAPEAIRSVQLLIPQLYNYRIIVQLSEVTLIDFCIAPIIAVRLILIPLLWKVLILMRLVDIVQSLETRSRLPLSSIVAIQMSKQRTHWSLNTRCGKLPSNIVRKPKITSGPSFFKSLDVGIIVDGVDVMAALEDLFDECMRKQRREKFVEEQHRAGKKENTTNEAGRRKRAHRKKRPM